jgi:hypothetical protein
MVIYLFQDNDTDVFALSTDRTGANIPSVDSWTNWRFRDSIADLEFSDGWNMNDFRCEMEDLTRQGFHIFRGDYLPLYAPEPQPKKTGAA